MANGCINNLQMEHGWTASAPSATVSRKPASCRAAGAGGLRHHRRRLRLQTPARHYLDELRHALDAARRETVSTLIDIKVLPKTMVHKYGSWWNVGSPRRRSRTDPQGGANDTKSAPVRIKTNIHSESYRLTEKTIMSLKLGVIGAGAIGKEHIRRCTQIAGRHRCGGV